MNAQHIRQSWTRQTDIDQRCDMQFPDLSKSRTRNQSKSSKIDQNGNKKQDHLMVSPGILDANIFEKKQIQNQNLPLENKQFSYSNLTTASLNDPKSTMAVITGTGLFPNYLMSLQQTLDSVTVCPVMDRNKMESLKDMMMVTSTENNLGSFYNVMQFTKQQQSKGLVHWAAGISKATWTVLGKSEEPKVGNNRKVAGLDQGGGREGIRTRSDKMSKITKDIISKAIQDSRDNLNNTDSDQQDDKDEGIWYRKLKDETEIKEQSVLKKNSEKDLVPPCLDETLYTTLSVLTRNTFTSLASTISAVTGYDAATTTTNDEVQEDINKVANKFDHAESNGGESIGTCPMCEVPMEMKALLTHASTCQGKN